MALSTAGRSLQHQLNRFLIRGSCADAAPVRSPGQPRAVHPALRLAPEPACPFCLHHPIPCSHSLQPSHGSQPPQAALWPLLCLPAAHSAPPAAAAAAAGQGQIPARLHQPPQHRMLRVPPHTATLCATTWTGTLLAAAAAAASGQSQVSPWSELAPPRGQSRLPCHGSHTPGHGYHPVSGPAWPPRASSCSCSAWPCSICLRPRRLWAPRTRPQQLLSGVGLPAS